MAKNPVQILVFSGKRKCGKDYLTEIVKNKIGIDICSILRLSEPLKSQYAKEKNLDLVRLLDSSEYKEKYRYEMIKWGEEKRQNEPWYFCNIICEGPGSKLPVWIISDARRQTDISFFKKQYGSRVITIRVEASENIRKERGWIFTEGVDDAESECDLDNTVFDLLLKNNGDDSKLQEHLEKICSDVQRKLNT